MVPLTLQERQVALILLLTFLAGLPLRFVFVFFPKADRSISILDDRFFRPRVDVNRATLEELIALPMIGEGAALRLLDRRRRLGPFSSMEEVQDVLAMSPARFASLKRYLVAGSGFNQ